MEFHIDFWPNLLRFLATIATFGLIALFARGKRRLERVFLGAALITMVTASLYGLISFKGDYLNALFYLVLAAIAFFGLIRYMSRIRKGRHLQVPELSEINQVFESLDEVQLEGESYFTLSQDSDPTISLIREIIQDYIKKLDGITAQKSLRINCGSIFWLDEHGRWKGVWESDADDILIQETTYEGSEDGLTHNFFIPIGIKMTTEHQLALLSVAYDDNPSSEIYQQGLLELRESIDWDQVRTRIMESLWNCLYDEFYSQRNPRKSVPLTTSSGSI